MGYDNSNERFLIEQTDRSHEGVHSTIQGAHPEAQKTIGEAAINPSDFIYSPRYKKEDIERDLGLVEKREKQFEHDDSQKPAEVFEAIMLHQGELSNWFGQHAETIKTSRYDDVFNGIDIIVEFENTTAKELSHLGVAVDVTFGTTGLQKKIERIKKEIDRGELARVKYFYSEKEGVREPRDVARVVVGIELNQVVELAALWLQQKNFQYKEIRSKANHALAAHPASRAMLEEISLQLERFKDYANKNNKKALSDIYEKDLVIVKAILAEKQKAGIRMGELKDDRVYNSIKETVERLFPL